MRFLGDYYRKRHLNSTKLRDWAVPFLKCNENIFERYICALSILSLPSSGTLEERFVARVVRTRLDYYRGQNSSSA